MPGGRPVARVVMAVDRRSDAEGRALAAVHGADALYRQTGLWDLSVTPLARFDWMRGHEPERASRVARLLELARAGSPRGSGSPRSWIRTLAARTLAYEVVTGDYGAAAHGLPVGLLSEVVPTGTILGTLPVVTAERLGPGGAPASWWAASTRRWPSLGAGAIAAGGRTRRQRQLGGAVGPGPRADRRSPAARGRAGRSGRRPLDGPRLEVMGSWAGGLALRWVVGLASGGRTSDAAVGRALARLPAGDARPVANPGLAGVPVMPLGGAGAIAALDLGMGHADLVLAVLDGLAHRLRLATLRAQGCGCRGHAVPGHWRRCEVRSMAPAQGRCDRPAGRAASHPRSGRVRGGGPRWERHGRAAAGRCRRRVTCWRWIGCSNPTRRQYRGPPSGRPVTQALADTLETLVAS